MDPLPDRVSDKVDRLSGWLLCTRSSCGGNGKKKPRTCRLVHWKSKAGRRDAFFCGHVGGGRARASVRARAYQVNVTAREREKEREEGRERESRALHFLKRRSRAATKKKNSRRRIKVKFERRWSSAEVSCELRLRPRRCCCLHTLALSGGVYRKLWKE